MIKKICNLFFLLVIVLGIKIANGQLTHIQYPEPPGIPAGGSNLFKNDLQIDNSDNKWVAFAKFGLCIYDGTSWIQFNTSNSTIPSDSIIAIAFDGMGNAWLGTKAGAVYKAGTNFTLYDSGNSGLPSNVVSAVYCEPNITWFGTQNGLTSFDGTNWTTYSTTNSGIANDSITCIQRDANGKLWVGTRNGLSQYFNNIWTNFTTSNSILDRFVIDIETDNQNRLWISSGHKTSTQPYAINVSGIYILSNSVISNFKSTYLQDYSPIIFYGNNHFGKDSAGSIYIYLNCISYGILRVNDSSIDQMLCVPYGGNILQFDQQNKLWSISTNSIYSLDFSNYFTPLNAPNIKNHRALNINDVNAGINVAGDMHWNGINTPRYEVPKNSGKNSVFASALWIGGLDASGQLHTAAQTYRQTGQDFWAGPIGNISIPFDSNSCRQFDKIWKIDKWKIEEFKNAYSAGNVSNGSYSIPEEITSWPAIGNGIVNNKLAPFIDFNNDGLYNPINGDYPEIKGDQLLYFIFNDSLAPHGETGGQKLGIEVHGSAYAYNCSNIVDSNIVLNRTTLYHYTIINRSLKDYHDVYTGIWNDVDLGLATDDYVGCDTTRQTAFVYNGDNDDETQSGYGLNPPMQNVKILRGTLADAGDGIDNNLDGTIDEIGERTAMNHFMYYNNVQWSPIGNPLSSIAYYRYLQSVWIDGQHLTYGNDGRDSLATETNFMFSGVPYDVNVWNEFNAGNPPEDRRFIMSSGPVSLNVGDTLTFDIAYVFSWDSLSPNGLTTSIARNQADLDKVQYWFDTNTFPSCDVYSVSLPERSQPENITLFPNPSLQNVKVISGDKQLIDHDYFIFNLQGAEVAKGRLNSGGIDLSKLSSQPYFLRIELPSGPITQKLIKM